MTNLKSSMNCIRFSPKGGDNFVSCDNEGLTYVWQTSFHDYKQTEAAEKSDQKQLSTQIYGNQKNTGLALEITENNLLNEQLSLKLENFSSQIHNISETILGMEQHITTNENNTKKLLEF